jgi:hypothetical protein
MHAAIRSLASIFETAVLRNRQKFEPIGREVFGSLCEAQDISLTPYWLRSHISAFGLFGHTLQGHNRGTFLSDSETQEYARAMSRTLRSEHLSGRLIPCRWDLQPVYTMIDTGEWDDTCRVSLDSDIQEHTRALDDFALMLYGNDYATDREIVCKICSYEPFLSAAESGG